MRTTMTLCVILLGLLCLTANAENVPFDNGWLRIDWSTDGQYVTILSTTDVAPVEGESHVWILTVYSHRFTDGLFAWQIHYSEDIDSVLVLPNDFLTARNFTTNQLGIEAELSEAGKQLSLRVPLLGAIPRLIAAGDLIEVHALWIQHEPLLSMTLPTSDSLAIQPSTANLSDATTDSSNGLPAGGGATVDNTGGEAVSTSLIPPVTRFIQGTSISHRFALENMPDVPPRIVLSYTLMRLHDDRSSEFARFSHVPYDIDTDLYAYSIETANLEPGRYSLRIDSSNSSLTAQMDLEIIAPND